MWCSAAVSFNLRSLNVDAPEVAGEPTVQVLMDPDQNSLASRVQPPFDQGNQIEVDDTLDVFTGR